MGGYLLWCSSHCFSHFPLACRNLRIDIITLDFTPALSEGDHYSMANAVAEVELDNGRSAEIYIAADYEYENSLITVIERDEDGCQDRAYDSESTQEWPLLDSFYSTVEPCHLSIARRRLQGGVRLLHH